MNCDMDYQKIFNKVQHNNTTEMLENCGIDDKYLCLIKNLYWNQTATVKVNHETLRNHEEFSEESDKDAFYFNLYSEAIFQEAQEHLEVGILLNEERLNQFHKMVEAFAASDGK